MTRIRKQVLIGLGNFKLVLSILFDRQQVAENATHMLQFTQMHVNQDTVFETLWLEFRGFCQIHQVLFYIFLIEKKF